MRCCKCNRPLQRAVALANGLPVGQVRAVTAGLVQPKGKAAEPAQHALPFVDTETLDLFPLTIA